MVQRIEITHAYQCSFCDKKYVNYKSAWGHEHKYCKNTESPHIKDCEHDWGTHWTLIAGEDNAYEPHHGFCRKCLVTEMDFD